MTSLGLYHDSIPEWLCIHKREQIDWKKEMLVDKQDNAGGPKVKTTILCNGEIMTFLGRQEMADFFKMSMTGAARAIKRMAENNDRKSSISGKKCILIEDLNYDS